MRITRVFALALFLPAVGCDDEVVDGATCMTTLQIADPGAPTFELDEITLWPPNHKMHEIRLLECAEPEDCDPAWDAYIVAVSSDEPVDANGDGNTEPDIVPVDPQTVSLRSERQGGSNGRVYSIGFEVADDAGNVGEGTCFVTVVHDQSGAESIDDGAAYTIDWSTGD